MIDYATDLVDTNTGTTTWQTLYENYPSQGTNTTWEDAGVLVGESFVPQPRDSDTRFYRVVLTGTNDPANIPQVSILSPTNGSTLTGDVLVSVSVTSSLDVDTIRFFVDGAEVGYNEYTETNFILNTCQFANGTHTLFAVAGNSSGAETTDDPNGNDYQENYGVSAPLSLNPADITFEDRQVFP